MFYREAGDFKTSYGADNQTFPIRFDRWRFYAVLAVAYGVIPFIINDYWANAVFVPFLIYAIAAIGLNIINMAFVTVVVGWFVFRGLVKVLPRSKASVVAAAGVAKPRRSVVRALGDDLGQAAGALSGAAPDLPAIAGSIAAAVAGLVDGA